VSGGSRASSIVTESLEHRVTQSVSSPDVIFAALREANTRIYEESRESDTEGMGSTAVVLHVNPDRFEGTIVHVGDSRAYRFRGGELTQLTEDHSVMAELTKRMHVEHGAQEQSKQLPNIPLFEGRLTRAVGLAEELSLSCQTVELQPGDVYLLCSDGLYRHVGEEQICSSLSGVRRGRSLEDVGRELIDTANSEGGTDNISVVLIALRLSSSFVKKLSLAILCGVIFASTVGVMFFQFVSRKRQQLLQQKAEVEEILKTEISLTQRELSKQRVAKEKLGKIHSKAVGKDLGQRLASRMALFLESYRSQAESAILKRDWTRLEALPQLYDSHFSMDLDARARNVVTFSRRKAKLPILWWQLWRNIQKGHFEGISETSKEYVKITSLITENDPIRKIARLKFSKDDSLANARLLLENWPFGENQDNLRESLIRRVRDYEG